MLKGRLEPAMSLIGTKRTLGLMVRPVACHSIRRPVVDFYDLALQRSLAVRGNQLKLMEKTMMRFMLSLFVAVLSGTGRLAAQNVDARGITSMIKLEGVIFGHLTELNGMFKLCATEVTFAPEGYLGVHHHVEPGIRYVLSGEVTFTEGGEATVYKAGEYFFETGNLAHTAQNKTKLPLRM